MQDIRSEIEERLADATKRRADLVNQIKALEIEVETLMKMMEIENQRLGDRAISFRKRASLSTAARCCTVKRSCATSGSSRPR